MRSELYMIGIVLNHVLCPNHRGRPADGSSSWSREASPAGFRVEVNFLEGLLKLLNNLLKFCPERWSDRIITSPSEEDDVDRGLDL